MNRIYQVIWNRARGMYMVVSELAKSRSKGSGAGGKRSKLFQPAAVLAVLLTFGVGGNAWAAVTIGTTDPGVSATVYTTDEVYTKIEVNAELEKKADLNTDGKVAAAVKADTADIATNATNDGNGKNIADTYATQESVNAALEKKADVNEDGKVDAAVKADTATTATNATNATNDGEGNNIAATYATKTALAGKQDKIADSLTIDGATGSTIINNNTIKVQDDVNTWHSTTITSSSIDFGSGATTISEDFIGTTSLSASKLTMDTESNPSITLYYQRGNYPTTIDATQIKTSTLTGTSGVNDGSLKAGTYVATTSTVGQNLNALDTAVGNEKTARIAADTALAGAVNGGMVIGSDNVLMKNSTAVNAETGAVTNSQTAVDTLIINQGKDNQVTIDEHGIKVGTNSSLMDDDGIYTGGDSYNDAKAALKATGEIKGADGKFTVDAEGSLTAVSGTIGTVNVATDGTVTGVKDLTASGTLTSGDTNSSNYTTISAGSTHSENEKIDSGTLYTSEATFDEKGSTVKVKDDIAKGSSTLTAGQLENVVSSNDEKTKSTFRQTTGQILAEVTAGTNTTSSTQTAQDITNQAATGTITNNAKNLVNTAADGITHTAGTSILDVVGNTTVTTTTEGTTFENTGHSTALEGGSLTKTTISGNTLQTGKATMDYAEVMKDLGVRGSAAIDQNLTVKGASDLQGSVTVGKELEVKGNTKLDGTLEVAQAASFKDIVTLEKDLKVGGNASIAGEVSASPYKIGDKTYIDKNGINANDQKITNVAPGELAPDSKDAVNGSQLYSTNQRVDRLDSRVDKVGASAAALANLHPLDFDEDSKVSVAAAVGNYGSAAAGALGVFYRPTDRVMLNVSSSFGNGENLVGGGVTFKLGRSSKRLEQAENTNAALAKQVNELQARLDALLGALNPHMSREFPDVPANHWAYEAVSKLAEKGILKGEADGKYHGDRTLTRYEMAEIIYNALSKGAKAEVKLVQEFRPELQALAAKRQA